jgi:hypothetical protein
MSVSIGELTSDIDVEGGYGPQAGGEPPKPESGWAEQEKHNAMQRRAAELAARTTSEGFDD